MLSTNHRWKESQSRARPHNGGGGRRQWDLCLVSILDVAGTSPLTLLSVLTTTGVFNGWILHLVPKRIQKKLTFLLRIQSRVNPPFVATDLWGHELLVYVLRKGVSIHQSAFDGFRCSSCTWVRLRPFPPLEPLDYLVTKDLILVFSRDLGSLTFCERLGLDNNILTPGGPSPFLVS